MKGTVRRFLERWGDDIYNVVFVVASQEDYDLYYNTLKFYFPRNNRDLLESRDNFPSDIDDINEFGAKIIKEREIRIAAFPGLSPFLSFLSSSSLSLPFFLPFLLFPSLPSPPPPPPSPLYVSSFLLYCFVLFLLFTLLCLPLFIVWLSLYDLAGCQAFPCPSPLLNLPLPPSSSFPQRVLILLQKKMTNEPSPSPS